MMRADSLASLTVLDAAGASVALGSLWRERAAVLVFVRHFGCIHCRDHVIQLRADEPQFRAAGAEMTIIGNGSPSFIEGFRAETGWQGALYTDPTLAAYRAAELVRGVTNTLDPRALAPTLRAFLRGGRQGRTLGDQWQQGGVVVIEPGDKVVWHHASGRPGDNAPSRDILRALAR
jgi:peroxiredoxin